MLILAGVAMARLVEWSSHNLKIAGSILYLPLPMCQSVLEQNNDTQIDPSGWSKQLAQQLSVCVNW